jgi:hypothetical protein
MRVLTNCLRLLIMPFPSTVRACAGYAPSCASCQPPKQRLLLDRLYLHTVIHMHAKQAQLMMQTSGVCMQFCCSLCSFCCSQPHLPVLPVVQQGLPQCAPQALLGSVEPCSNLCRRLGQDLQAWGPGSLQSLHNGAEHSGRYHAYSPAQPVTNLVRAVCLLAAQPAPFGTWVDGGGTDVLHHHTSSCMHGAHAHGCMNGVSGAPSGQQPCAWCQTCAGHLQLQPHLPGVLIGKSSRKPPSVQQH